MLRKLQRLVNGARADGEDGFTLIELLIVVVIIGILAAIAIPQFSSTKESAYEATVKSDLRNAMTSMETYFARNNGYPTSQSDAENEVELSDNVSVTNYTHSSSSQSFCFEMGHGQLDNDWNIANDSTAIDESPYSPGTPVESAACQ